MKTNKLKQNLDQKELRDEYRRTKEIKNKQTQLIIWQMNINFLLTNLRGLILFTLFVTNLINGNTDFALQALLPLLNNQ